MKIFIALLISATIFVLLCIHAESKPLTQNSSAAAASEAEKEYENGLDLLRRFTRQATPANGNNNKVCKYKKGSWSACDPQTKFRTRTFTLKRGDAAVCEEQKTIRKECNKGKKEGGKKNKARQQQNQENNNNNNQPQQPKNNRERDRPRKKNNHNNN